MISLIVFCLLVHFVPVMLLDYRKYFVEEECGFSNEKEVTLKLQSIGLNSTAILRPLPTDRYSTGVRCFINILPPVQHGVIIKVLDYNLQRFERNYRGRYESGNPYLKIYLPVHFTNPNSYDNYWMQYSGLSLHDLTVGANKLYYSNGLVMFSYSTISRHESNLASKDSKGFEILVTAYSKDQDCDGPVRFRCKKGHCIWSNLICDGYDNCGDNSDESLDICANDANYTETYFYKYTVGSRPRWIFLKMLPSGRNSSGILKWFKDYEKGNWDSTVNALSKPFDCLASFIPPTGYGTLLVVQFHGLDPESKCICTDDSFKVYWDNEVTELCNVPYENSSYVSFFADNSMQIQFSTNKNGSFVPGNVSIIYTAYSKDIICSSPGQFKCGNQKCISSELKCDGLNNCGDNSDETCEICGGCGYSRVFLEDYCPMNEFKVVSRRVPKNSYGILEPNTHNNYAKGIDCHFILLPPSGCGIVLSINKIGFEIEDCSEYLMVYNGTTSEKMCKQKIYPKASKHISSTGPLHLYYRTENSTELSGDAVGFSAVYTIYDLECSDERSFHCKNGKCILSELRCDTHNNCGDGSDEIKCPQSA